jgi:hypothetical protein
MACSKEAEWPLWATARNMMRFFWHVNELSAADGLSRFRLPLVFLPLNDLVAVAGGLLKLCFVHNR